MLPGYSFKIYWEKQWDKHNKAGYVLEELGHRKIEFVNGRLFFAFFLSPNVKFRLIFIEYGVTGEKNTFRGFEDFAKFLGRKNFLTCKMD